MSWPDEVSRDIEHMAEIMMHLRQTAQTDASRQLAFVGEALLEEVRAIVADLEVVTERHRAGEDVGAELERLEGRWEGVFRRLVEHLEQGRALLKTDD